MARERVRLEVQALETVIDVLDDSTLEIVDLLLKTPGKVFVTGSGTSGTVAHRMAHLLSLCGTPAAFIHPGDALHGTMGVLEADDVLIAISRGGGSSEINQLVERAQTLGVKAVALTNNGNGKLAELADFVQVFPTPEGADPGDVIAMGTTLMHSAWGDAVTEVLMRLRGHTWDELLFTHPSGAVGQLTSAPPPIPAISTEGNAS